MNDNDIRADSFFVNKHRLRIYRVRHRRGATVLWLRNEMFLRYLRIIQKERLQARKEGQ